MKRIALVEDGELMREELARMLEKADYEIAQIREFKDVPEQLLALSPDLVLLDLNLPGTGGFQICREIKQKSAIPVLVLTSRDQMRDELKALELGADEYLTKPCRKERLLARISNVLKRYEGRQNLLEGTIREGQRNCDELSVRLAEYEEYVESWAHEAKIPLSLLTLILDNRREELPETVGFKLDYIRNRLREYTEQMLYYARIKGTHKDYLFEHVDVGACIGGCWRTTFPCWRKRALQSLFWRKRIMCTRITGDCVFFWHR